MGSKVKKKMSAEKEETVNTNVNEEQKETEEVGSKSEKKVRKALGKLGMTKVENVNRVTIRQKDNYILIVKNPEVFTSSQTENTYIIFGEITFDDPEKKMAKEEIEKMRDEGEKLRPTEELSEEGVSDENIQNVMNEAKCSRKQAVRALKACDNDVVGAILKLAG